MIIRLHSHATTTPKTRAALQASSEPASTLAKRYSISELTVYKWRKRDGVEDYSHIPHRLQTTLALEASLTLALDVPEDTDMFMPMTSRLAQLTLIDVLATSFTLRRSAA